MNLPETKWPTDEPLDQGSFHEVEECDDDNSPLNLIEFVFVPPVNH